MLGRTVGGGIAFAALVGLAAVLAGPAQGRGGNHGCVPADRYVFSSHWRADGDHIFVAYYVEEVGLPPETQRRILMENADADGGNRIGRNCSDAEQYTQLRSNLGPDDDSIRMDGKGMSGKATSGSAPLPRRMATLVTGGTGDDLIRGHAGFDDMSGGGGGDRLIPGDGRDRVLGGGGADVIKAAGGRSDNVQCGAGRDKAVVDRSDDTRGCERVIVR